MQNCCVEERESGDVVGEGERGVERVGVCVVSGVER